MLVTATSDETGGTVSDRLSLTVPVPNATDHAAPGVEVKFEKANARKALFDFCEQSRCVATLAADAAFIRDMSAAGTVTIVMQTADGKPVNIDFPIKGFEKAYGKMTKG